MESNLRVTLLGLSASVLRSSPARPAAGRGRSPASRTLAPRASARPARRPHSGRAKTRAQAAAGSQDREWTAGMPAAVFAPWVAAVLGGLGVAAARGAAAPAPLAVAVLGAELEPLQLSRAAQVGLPADWVAALARLDPLRRQARRRPPAPALHVRIHVPASAQTRALASAPGVPRLHPGQAAASSSQARAGHGVWLRPIERNSGRRPPDSCALPRRAACRVPGAGRRRCACAAAPRRRTQPRCCATATCCSPSAASPWPASRPSSACCCPPPRAARPARRRPSARGRARRPRPRSSRCAPGPRRAPGADLWVAPWVGPGACGRVRAPAPAGVLVSSGAVRCACRARSRRGRPAAAEQTCMRQQVAQGPSAALRGGPSRRLQRAVAGRRQRARTGALRGMRSR